MDFSTDTNTEHYTPSKELLKSFHEIKCSQPDCSSIFINQSNYEMHLEKHHGLPPPQKPLHIKIFHCPEDNCVYNYSKPNSKHFKNYKYLRQHYQKVHMVKDFQCEECRKSFATESLLSKHQRDICGKKFVCNECQWSYNSMEALLTHGKRKGHNVREVLVVRKSEAKIVNKPLKKLNKQENAPDITKQVAKEIQVDFCPKMLCASSVQTDFLPNIKLEPSSNQYISKALDEIHSLLRDIETQTEPMLSSTSSESNHNYLDQMLAQSSHMYTQTCNDYLTELGLSDIQTQTNWPSPDPHNDNGNVQFNSTATSTNPCIHDELLVSTETQTSFAQCLLNSCSSTGTSTPPVTFGSLYHTQHTQTCDPLLESFDFGGQASDLIDGFQSTYTQT